jgi:hypothetical protein
VPVRKLELLLTEVGGLTTFGLAKRANADRDLVLALLRKWKPPAGSAERASAVGHAGTRSPTRSESRNALPSWPPRRWLHRDQPQSRERKQNRRDAESRFVWAD